MNALIFILSLGIFAYHSAENGRNFRGSSMAAQLLCNISGVVGNIVYYILLIWSFWYFAWWMPIAVFVARILLGGFTAFFFQGNILGIIASPILTIGFAIASIVSLLSL